MPEIIVFLLPMLSSFAVGEVPDVSQDTYQEETGIGEAEQMIWYTSPSANGAYLGESFDDPWMFERNWVISKSATSAIRKNQERWSLVPMFGADWSADLGLTLARGCRHVSASRLLNTPLQLSSQPLVVQFQLRLPVLQQCAGVQLRLLTDSDDLQLDQVTHVTPFALLFGAERCAGHVKLHLGVRYVDSETGGVVERRAAPVSGLEAGLDTHRYRLLLTTEQADTTARLLMDHQLLADISLRSLIESTSQSGDRTEEDGDEPEHTKLASKVNLESVGAVSMELWSAGVGLYLDNLIITNSPEQADVFTPSSKPSVQATNDILAISITGFLQYSSERPWMYFVIVLAIGVPACLLISCCLPESLDLEAQRKKSEARRKKTDGQQANEQPGDRAQRRAKRTVRRDSTF